MALAESERKSRSALATKFGMTIIPRTATTNAVTTGTGTNPRLQKSQNTSKQMSMDRFILDSMLIDAAKSATKAAAVNAKEEAKPKRRSKKTAEVNV